MKKVSLITTWRGTPPELSKAILEVKSFTQKLPVPWEIIVVLDPPAQPHLDPTLVTPDFQIQILQNHKKLGRAPSILKGLKAATGDALIVFPLDMTIPLAEVFQFLQELTVDPELAMVIGNRFTSRKKMISKKSSWHQTLEKILLEKFQQRLPNKVVDPLCAYFGIRKTFFDQIKDDLSFSSWYWTPELITRAAQKEWKILEAPVLSRDQKPSSIPVAKELLRAAFSR